MKAVAQRLFLGVLAALVAAGVIAGVVQLRDGLAATALHEPGVWGLYVVCFAYFLGLGAGALTVASAAFCTGRDEHRPVAVAASVVSLVALMVAGLFVTIDLGRPERAYLMILKMQVRSPLFWDFLALNTMAALATLYIVPSLRAALIRAGGSLGRLLETKLKALSALPRIVRLVAGPMVVIVPALYLVTTRVFSSVPARAPWHTSILGPVFLVSALLSGLAAVTVVTQLAGGFGGTEPGKRARRLAAGGLASLLIADVVLLFVPLGTMQQFDAPAISGIGGHLSSEVLFELVVGLLAPLVIILATWRRERPVLMAPCALILVGVLVKRWHIIISGSLYRNLPLPAASYHPNGVELAVSAGLLALGLLVAYVLVRLTTRPAPEGRPAAGA